MIRLILTVFLVYAICLPEAFNQTIVINEIMSDNETTVADEDGDFSDWFELFNASLQTINLQGYCMSDDTTNLCMWQFPDLMLESGSFLLVFASGKDRNTLPFLHTNFKIDADGEYLILTDSTGLIVDLIMAVETENDIAYGRKPDGTDNWYFIDFPTPARTNALGNTLHFSNDPGFYTNPFWLKIGSDNTDDQLHYTINGCIPTFLSPIFPDSILMDYKYNISNHFTEIPTTPDSGLVESWWISPDGPVDKANILRIRSYQNNIPTSKIYSKTFFVDTAIFGKYPYPVISLITDSSNLFDYDTGIYVPGVHWDSLNAMWTGNYYKSGAGWERDMHINYFNESGESGFAQDAGVRIHGKQTRRRPQKTLRFYARTEYGEKTFHYQLFPQKPLDKFDNFLLTTTYRCWNKTIFKDPLAHSIARDLGLDIMDYRPVVVFINGEYWGIQTIRDYLDEDYLSAKYDVPECSIDLLENNKQVVYGSNEEYIELFDFIENHDLSIPGNYAYVNSKIDIENFIDYEICEIYLNNLDWPGSNIKYWKSDELDNKWRWLLFDLDGGFAWPEYNMLEHATLADGVGYPNPDWSTLFLRKLLGNETFKNLFVERFSQLLNTTFQRDSILNKIEEFRSQYDLEIERHIFRWHFPASKEFWYSSINSALIGFAKTRPCIIRNQIMDFFDLTEFGFSCDTSSSFDTVKIYNQLNYIYPNPNKGKFKVHLFSPKREMATFILYDTFGEQVFEQSNMVDNANSVVLLNCDDLGSGIYLLHINFSGRTQNLKVVIVK